MDRYKIMVDLLDTLSATIEDNAELKAENAELKKQIEVLHEKITRDSREAFGVMARLNAENDELRAHIEAIKATDHAKVIDALLADKTNLKYALNSIVSIVKVAEQL